MQKLFEINGNLSDSNHGISNYDLFERCVVSVKRLFDSYFGGKSMSKIPIYIDNATKDSGYTPITTKVLNKILVIKLGIDADSDDAKIIYQFSHELTHAVFLDYYGFNKPSAVEREESICSAVSLITIKELCPNDFQRYLEHVNNLDNVAYRNGIIIAKSCSFNINEIKKLIIDFDEYKQ